MGGRSIRIPPSATSVAIVIGAASRAGRPRALERKFGETLGRVDANKPIPRSSCSRRAARVGREQPGDDAHKQPCARASAAPSRRGAGRQDRRERAVLLERTRLPGRSARGQCLRPSRVGLGYFQIIGSGELGKRSCDFKTLGDAIAYATVIDVFERAPASRNPEIRRPLRTRGVGWWLRGARAARVNDFVRGM